MLAKDLAATLLKNPEYEVTFSVDVSTCEGDAGVRAFGEGVHDIISDPQRKQFTVCSEGVLNYPAEDIVKMQKEG